MSQLGLSIKVCLPYTADNFVLHQGVREVVSGCLALCSRPGFQACFVSGARRCGKSHLTLKLLDELLCCGLEAQLIEGAAFADWLEREESRNFSAGQTVVVDDAQLYLSRLREGQSGGVVRLMEDMRSAGAKLLLFSSVLLADFKFDQHIESRLKPGSGFSIGHPGEADMAPLLRQMARQRGLTLGARKLSFLEKRVERSVIAIEDFLDRLLTKVGRKRGAVDFCLLEEALTP